MSPPVAGKRSLRARKFLASNDSLKKPSYSLRALLMSVMAPELLPRKPGHLMVRISPFKDGLTAKLSSFFANGPLRRWLRVATTGADGRGSLASLGMLLMRGEINANEMLVRKVKVATTTVAVEGLGGGGGGDDPGLPIGAGILSWVELLGPRWDGVSRRLGTTAQVGELSSCSPCSAPHASTVLG